LFFDFSYQDQSDFISFLKPLVILSASKQISANDQQDHLFLLFKLLHLLKEDTMSQTISDIFVQQYTREHTGTLVNLLVEMWKWIGEELGYKATSLPWFVGTYNMLVANISTEFAELGKAPENWSLNINWTCCSTCTDFVKYCNDNIRKEYRVDVHSTVHHLNTKIRENNLEFLTRTVPNVRKKRAETFVYTKKYSALSRRIEFLRAIASTLRQMFPNNATTNNNNDDTQANKRPKLNGE